MRIVVLLLCCLAYQPCNSRSLPEDSVVSVYTTLPTTAGTHPSIDVYHQIANNIAERITSPIYKFLGINSNKTTSEKTTNKTWQKIELLDEIPDHVTQPSYDPVNNDISGDRDVEELSVEALKKANRKPEKITLYSSNVYLPARSNLETFDDDTATEAARKNDVDDDDDGLTLDDVDKDEPRDGYFIYILELIGSFFQLLWGGLNALFKPRPGTS